jgi:hypothetical protein
MPGAAEEFLKIVQGSDAGQAQQAREVAAQRTQRAVGPSPTQPREIPSHLQNWGNYGREMGGSMVQQFLDLVRHPESMVGTEGLRGGIGMAIPRAGSRFVPLETLKAGRAAGKTGDELAAEFKMNPRTLDKKAAEYRQSGELERLRPGPQATKIDWGEVKRLQERGLSLVDIAKQVGVSQRTFSRAREREGMPIGAHTKTGEQAKLTRNQLDTISKMLKQGLTDKEIARRYNVAPGTISARRKAIGVDPLPRGRAVQTEQVEKLRTLMQEHGTSWKKIGAAMGISAQSAYGFAVRHGLVDVERIMEGERARAKRGTYARRSDTR